MWTVRCSGAQSRRAAAVPAWLREVFLSFIVVDTGTCVPASLWSLGVSVRVGSRAPEQFILALPRGPTV